MRSCWRCSAVRKVLWLVIKESKSDLINPDSIPETRKIYYKTGDSKPVEGIDSLFTEAKVLYNTYHNQGVIIFDREITEIPKGAFRRQNITEITLPENVRSIGIAAFAACLELRKIKLPSRLKTIEAGAFDTCVKLYSITIPESVENIAAGVFERCFALKKISGKFASSDGHYLIDRDRLIAVASNGLKNFTIPANIKMIDMDLTRWLIVPPFAKKVHEAVCCKAQTPPQCTTYDKRYLEDMLNDAGCSLGPLYVPASSVELYENDPYWSHFRIVGYAF